MRPGYKQRPPHWSHGKSPALSSDTSNSVQPEIDAWTPKERQTVSPPRPRPIPTQVLVSPVDDSNIQAYLPEVEKSPYDLTFHLTAYDGCPIIIVPPHYFDVIAGSFKAGLYGLDTESDCTTGELRIIQIYTQTEVYIFSAAVLDELQDNLFIKFLRSKDRIKVGVDIDNDVFVMRRHINKRRVRGKDNHLKNKFAVNGIIDVQSIARSVGEPLLSLDKLAAKYVEGFSGNPQCLGTFNPPTNEQYIYAANDAVLSLKIYHPLRTKTPARHWVKENCPPPVPLKPPRPSIQLFPVGLRGDPTEFEKAARAIMAEEEVLQKAAALEAEAVKQAAEADQKAAAQTIEPELETKANPRAQTPEPEHPQPIKKNGKKAKKSKRKGGKSPSSSPQLPDEIDRIVQSLEKIPAAVKSDRKGPVTVSPELQQKFKEKMASMKKHRMGKCGKACLEKVEEETAELLNELDHARKKLAEGDERTKELTASIQKACKCTDDNNHQCSGTSIVKAFEGIGVTRGTIANAKPLPKKPSGQSRKFMFYDPVTKQSRIVQLSEADLKQGSEVPERSDSPELIKATERLRNLKNASNRANDAAGVALARQILPGNPGNAKEILDETIDRMISLNNGFSSEEFYELLTKATLWFGGLAAKPQNYSDLLLFILDIPNIRARYVGTDCVLIANIFINMAIENGYFKIESDDRLKLVR